MAPNLPVVFHAIDILNIASTKTTLACGYSLHGSLSVEKNNYQVFILPLNSIKTAIPNYPNII